MKGHGNGNGNGINDNAIGGDVKMMRIFMVLVPMTVLVIAAYFILVTAEKAQDPRIKAFGKYLSIWVVLLSALLVVGAAVAPGMGGRGFGLPLPRGAGFRPPDFPPLARQRLIRERGFLEQAPGGKAATDGAVQPQDQEPKAPPTPAP